MRRGRGDGAEFGGGGGGECGFWGGDVGVEGGSEGGGVGGFVSEVFVVDDGRYLSMVN